LKEIPEIEFNSSYHGINGFEIIKLQKIIENKDSYENNPEYPHQPNFYNLIFYTSGVSEQLVDFKWFPIKRNSLVYITKKQINAFSFTPGLQGFCLLFSQEYFEKCFSHLDKEIVFRLFSPQLFEPTLQIPLDSDLEQYIKLLYKEYYDKNSFDKNSIIESLFTIILTKAEHLNKTTTDNFADNSKTNLFLKFTDSVENGYHKSRNADSYAVELAITYKHLNNICKELVNKTAKKFIDDYVILEAKRKLVNSDSKSSKLAYILGFDDPTNFIKYFKNQTGLTPNQFKNSLTNNQKVRH